MHRSSLVPSTPSGSSRLPPPTPSSRLPLGSTHRPSISGNLSAASTSRIPATPSSRIPLGSKRTSSAAGLEEPSSGIEPPSTIRRTNLLLQHDLERRLRAAQTRELELQSQLDDAKRELDSVRDANRRLVDDEQWREQELEAKRNEEAEEKKRIQARVLKLQTANQTLESTNASLSESLSTIQRTSQHQINALENDLALLQSRYDAAEEEVSEQRDRAEDCGAEVLNLRERVAELIEELERLRREEGEEKVGRVLREELHRQAKNLQTQEATLAAQKAELAQLRSRRDDADALRQELKASERAWAERYQSAEDFAESLRKDLDALASSKEAATADAEPLRAELATALALQQETLAKLSAAESTISALHDRLETLSTSSQNACTALTIQVDNLSRDLSAALDAKEVAETRIEQLKRASKGGGEAAELKIKELEGEIAEYKADWVQKEEVEDLKMAIDSLNDDLNELANLRSSVGLLTASNEEKAAEITSLQASIELLERRVAIGEYDPTTMRCLQLAINPSTQDLAIRTATLEALKVENQALLEQLRGGEGAPDSVPRATYDAYVQEKEEEKKQMEKRLLRLKEVFKAKSQEFLDTLYSLLGYRIQFSDNGDVRMNSTYAPKGKSGVTFRFSSHEGHFGTMQLTGGLAKSLDELRDFWVTQRKDIPCFLAAVTLELYDRTTRGKAVGWVRGLDGEEDE